MGQASDTPTDEKTVHPVLAGRRRRGDILPVVALRGIVMFPGITTRIAVGRPRSLAALDEALGGDRRLVLVAQREAQVDRPRPEDLYDVGVVCAVQVAADREDGQAKIVVVNGLERCRITQYVQQEPYIAVRTELVAPLDEDVPTDLRQRLKQLLRAEKPGERARLLDTLPESVALDDYAAFGLELPVADKQALLAEPSRLNRCRMLLPVLEVEAQIARAGRRIRSRYAPTTSQRREYLQERRQKLERQLRELSGESTDLDALRDRVCEAELPPDVRKEAERELGRLGRMPPGSPEYGPIEDYLDWLLSLPWRKATEALVDLPEARRVLDEDHYDRDEVKERVIEFLSVRLLRPEEQGALLCFVGAPGVGKTSLGRSIARATRREFRRIALGGTRDEAEIRGHRRTYVGALPGRIIRALRAAGVRNPVIQLDEIDKLGSGPMGDPASALLEVLDPEQNSAFVDSYLALPFDLSQIMFIATANTTRTVPAALLDRMEVIELPGYATEEKVEIARRYLVPKQLKATGLDEERVDFDVHAIESLVERYTREAGVRSLERQVASLCRKMARDYVSGRCRYRYVDAALVDDLLGPPLYHPGIGEADPRPGVCPTLSLTSSGAELMLVEALKAQGDGKLIVTGRVGDIVRESAALVHSYWRSSTRELPEWEETVRKSDLHIHFPGAAAPVEGTSAGLAMSLALVSLLSGKCVPATTAVLGEVTLRGRVLGVEGLRERLAGAARAGIEMLVLPEANRADVEAAGKGSAAPALATVYVRTVREAVEAVLPGVYEAAPAPSP